MVIGDSYFNCCNKIELNRQTNQTLEQIAQAIFKSWFVDFEPVKEKIKSKQNGQDSELATLCAISGKTEEQLKGLDKVTLQQLKTTAALFPDALVDSELGEIPEGWSIGVLGDVIEQRNERIKASIETEELPYVPIDCISSASLFLSGYKNGEEAKSSLTKIFKNDFIFGAMRPYFHKVCISPFDATTRATAFVLKPKKDFDFSFSILRLYQKDTIDFATLHSTGSTIPYAKWSGSLSEMKIIIPSKIMREQFDSQIKPMLDSIAPKIFEIKSLINIRDALLPKLLSGDLQPEQHQAELVNAVG